MHVRISIPDMICITGIGAASWFLAGHEVTWGMWVAYGSYAAGRLTQWFLNWTSN